MDEGILNAGTIRVTIRDKSSTWKEDNHGVPQGSVLTPIMFAIQFNNMDEGVGSYMTFFADEAKFEKVMFRKCLQDTAIRS